MGLRLGCEFPTLLRLNESGDDLTIGQLVSGLVIFAVIGGVIAAVRRRDEDAAIYVLGGLVILGSFWLASKEGVLGFVAGLIGFTFLAVFIWFISEIFKPDERLAQRQQRATKESIPKYEGPPADPATAVQIDAPPAHIRGEAKRDITREQALAAFHERYRRSLVRWFEITDTGPDGCEFDDIPANCWLVQFNVTYDDTLLRESRWVAVSKSTGEIVYDDSANDDGSLRC